MERCRKKLVAALKTGGTFALYLGGVTIEHADFKTKLCKKVRCYSYLNTNTHTQYLYIRKQIIKKRHCNAILSLPSYLQDVFPKDAFTAAGAKLLQPDYEPRYKILYREADLEQGQAIARYIDPQSTEERMGNRYPLPLQGWLQIACYHFCGSIQIRRASG